MSACSGPLFSALRIQLSGRRKGVGFCLRVRGKGAHPELFTLLQAPIRIQIRTISPTIAATELGRNVRASTR